MNLAYLSDIEFIDKITEITLNNIGNENFSVKDLSHETGVSLTYLNSRLQKIKSITARKFICEVRLKKAYELLHEHNFTAAEVAYKVGFASATYFNKCFHGYFGYPPGDIKRRIGEEQNSVINGKVLKSDSDAEIKSQFRKRENVKAIFYNKTFRYLVVGILLLLILLVFLSPNYNFSFRKLKPEEKSIAVLPFEYINTDVKDDFIADWIIADVLSRLNEIKEIRVVPSTSVEKFRNSPLSIPEIAKKLDVNFILKGNVLQSDGRVKIIVELIDAKHDRLILTQQFDRDLKDIYSIQSSISKMVAEKLQAVLAPDEIEAIERKPNINEEALQYYLMGNFSIYKRVGEERSLLKDLQNGLDFYKRSISIDSGYAPAYAGLAEVYYLMTYWHIIPRDSGFALAKENALHAIQIDNTLAEAHSVLGQLYALNEWKWEKAREEFLLAINECPDDPFIHAQYSELLNILGENAAAREQINLALQIDPTINQFHRLSMDYYFNEGKLNESLQEIEKINEFRPSPQRLTLWQKAYIYDRLNDDIQAIQALKEIMKMEEPQIDYAAIIDSTYKKEGAIGIHTLMLNILKADTLYPQYFLAQVYARLGRKQEAIACLRKSIEKREIRLPRINNDPRCVYIRKEPYFREIIEKMGLGPYFDPNKDFSPVAN